MNRQLDEIGDQITEMMRRTLKVTDLHECHQIVGEAESYAEQLDDLRNRIATVSNVAKFKADEIVHDAMEDE